MEHPHSADNTNRLLVDIIRHNKKQNVQRMSKQNHMISYCKTEIKVSPKLLVYTKIYTLSQLYSLVSQSQPNRNEPGNTSLNNAPLCFCARKTLLCSSCSMLHQGTKYANDSAVLWTDSHSPSLQQFFLFGRRSQILGHLGSQFSRCEQTAKRIE